MHEAVRKPRPSWRQRCVSVRIAFPQHRLRSRDEAARDRQSTERRVAIVAAGLTTMTARTWRWLLISGGIRSGDTSMMTSATRVAIAAATAIVAAACGGSSPNSPSTSTPTLHGEVADSAGDAVTAPGGVNTPDLVHATVDVRNGSVMVTIQFASGTFDRQSTRLTIELDTDQNPGTGIVAAGLGIDYILDEWVLTNQTRVQQATPAECAGGGSCYADVGAVALSFGADSMTATVPLTMLGNASGRLNYRVFAYASPRSTTTTAIADVMPDINLPAARVP